MSKRIIAAAILGIVLTAASWETDLIQEAEKKAVQAAESWLALVDAGKFAESWESSASLLRNVVTKEEWNQMIRSARVPFGGVIERKLKSREYATSLPGAPDGQYVIIQYDTSFEHKQAAVETITPMLGGDGQWRVSGYFIR